MKDQIFSVLQRVGRSFMLPIAILPVAGLFLGIGASFTNPNMLETYGLTDMVGKDTILYAVLSVMAQCGDIVFANLPLLFAIGVAIGMAKREKEIAALSSVIAFMVMHTAIGAMIVLTQAKEDLVSGSITLVMGITSLQMGVFGGMLVGLGVAVLHNKYYKIELPQILSFFGGTRFVPIISAVTFLFVGIAMFYIWPNIQEGIYAVGDVVTKSGYAGTFVYGFMERILIPFGLHHVFYLPFWQTALGGVMTIDGVVVEGAQNIFFAQLASPNTTEFSVSATRFMSGKFPLMIFALPGAALAMYHVAKDQNKFVVKGLLVSAALTAMLTGITEPLEFTFLFIAPLLYVIHCVGAGLAYMLMHLFNVGVGMTFSGGIIDLTLYGILQGNDKTHWLMVMAVGIVYFVVYYAIFRFLIIKLNLKTPGREDEGEETKLYTRKDVEAQKKSSGTATADGTEQDVISGLILQGLGGKDNIEDIDCCATRLRITVVDAALVQEEVLKQSGAAGVVIRGLGVQVIYGPRVSIIKSQLEEYLLSPASHRAMSAVVEGATDGTEEKTISEQGRETVEEKGQSFSITFTAPMRGTMAPLAQTPDESFSQEMIGKGVVFFPENSAEKGELYAPCTAEVSFVFDTKHALGLTTPEGIEILLHIGIDTVELNGAPFEVLVQEGATVHSGQVLARFDTKAIEDAGKSTATPMVFTNLEDGQTLHINDFGAVQEDTAIMVLKS